MGGGSAGRDWKCIMRYSRKRLRKLWRRKRGGCIHAADVSSEMSTDLEFERTSKRSFTSDSVHSDNKQFPDCLKDNSSSKLPTDADFTPLKESPDPLECEKKAEIVPQHESRKETSAKPNLVGDQELVQVLESPDPLKDRESPGILLEEEPKKMVLKPDSSVVHGSEISSVRRLQSGEVCGDETEAGTADHEVQIEEGSPKPAIVPEPIKGIVKPGISMVHESAVPSTLQPHPAHETEAGTAEVSGTDCDHPPETHADGDCGGRWGLEGQQQNTLSSNLHSALISSSPRSASDVARSFGLVTVPPSRGASSWSPLSAAAELRAATPQSQTCSQCQNAYLLGKPPRLLKAEQIKLATNNFCKKNFLDNGEWEFVYKGCLEGQPVAIKTIRHEKSPDKFSTEIAVLTSLQHPNVVSLVGYCLEENNRALVYNYACNRSLFWHLCCVAQGTKVLTWTVRKALAIYLARGLHYLHSECMGGGIIHGDFRSKNIFLNHDMLPMIGGFGQSRFQESGLNPLPDRPRKGYPGYVAPEYLEGGQLSEKVDVYGFGIVLLELITGRAAVDRSRPQELRDLVDWARPWLELESPTDYDTIKKEMLDAQLVEDGRECCEVDVLSTIHAARLCLRKDPLLRPRMNKVLDILANSDCDDLQESGCSFLDEVSTVAIRNDSAVSTSNRTSQSAALGLATLRAADRAPASSTTSISKTSSDPEDMEFRSAPATPNLNELVRRDTDFAGTWSSRRSSRSSASGKVTQLLYQPRHYWTNSSCNKRKHQVRFKKSSQVTRLSYNDLLGDT